MTLLSFIFFKYIIVLKKASNIAEADEKKAVSCLDQIVQIIKID